MQSTLACLERWMAQQRWYAAKGRTPRLRSVAHWEVPAPEDPGARVVVHLVADESAQPATLYQVPVVERDTPAVDMRDEHVIGSPVPGMTLIDGPFDPAFTRALHELVTRGGQLAGCAGRVIGAPLPIEHRQAAVLTGEQSNTSIVYRGPRRSVICKIFRQVQPGTNPDIELSSALANAGSPHVPSAVGAVEATWHDPDRPGDAQSGSLAFAQEFLAGVEDEWRVALRAVASESDFSGEAAALGAATAHVHAMLAAILPTRAATEQDRAATAVAWTRRLTIASAEIPAIGVHADAIRSVYESAGTVTWPRLQRIHGDLHLGQVLQVPGRGCVLLDFEGEPLRPMRERVLPDLALRDVAGVLRSFDYVVGSVRSDDAHPAGHAQEWARDARRAFLAGYSAAAGADVEQPALLLIALELDKAVYECIYEARNRPDWLGIPLAGVTRLLARARSLE